MLNELFDKYGSDKGTSRHNYGPAYEKLFDSRREKVARVLEIGVFHGASLQAWRDYFPNATILGADSDASTLRPFGQRIVTFMANQESPVTLRLNEHTYIYDVIIDDGSHLLRHQIMSLFHLWPQLSPGGLYVIEDLQDWGFVPCFDVFKNCRVVDLRKNQGDDSGLIVMEKT